ncbi:FAD-dependent oxidoreductase [Lysobacter korlensis]|uniref:FAD-dependent oxidoreductase n=1 Tax=Lysobacter korlensis TaxID=553636 RepID=A0ABV6RSX7_9GAMM
MPHNGDAVIIGGGIAGLATAAGLSRAGWSVSVLERAETPPEGGTALGMWPEAMAALDSLGIGDPVRDLAVECRGALILRADGTEIASVGQRRSAHLISRAQLLSVLRSAVEPGIVRWGVRLDPSDDLPAADLVVGADGINSAVRARFWPEAGVRPLRTVAYRGVVTGRVDTVTETWGPGALFGITPAGRDLTNWFACMRVSADDLDGADDSAHLLRRRFGSWHPAVRRIVESVIPEEIDRRTLHDVHVGGPYVRGSVALVGDAAHAMAPNLGRGACESLIDAVVLARAVTDADTVDGGLRAYDRIRRRRTRRVVAAARMLNRVATAERGRRLRDGLAGMLSTDS